MPALSTSLRPALVLWLYVAAIVHILAGLTLTWAGHSGLLDGGAKAAEVMAALDETGVGAAPGMNAFAELTWRPEDEREFDDYVQCTECDRWHHFVCAMYPAPEQMPASWQAVHWSFVCSGCKGAGQAKQITALQNRRAASLPKCAMAVAVEAFVAKELKAAKVKVAAPIKEVLPKNGLVYSEKGAMSEMLCRPKILPIKSAEALEAERKETEAKIQEDEERRVEAES